jgi:hypothetical protein
MPYNFDVYVSYRRRGEWPTWVKRHFLPLIYHWLSERLGRDPLIFFHERFLEIASPWPAELAKGLATSRVMVCLWSRSYFESDWCLAELSQMLYRQEASGNPRLILPVLVHDGDRIPAPMRAMQPLDISEYTNPRMVVGSPNSEKLSHLLKTFSESIFHAIDTSPPFRRELEFETPATLHPSLRGTVPQANIVLPKIT